VSIFPELKKEFQSGNPFSDVPMQGASMKLTFGGVITIFLLLFVVSACGATTTTEDIATTAAPTLPIQTTTLTATNIPPTITPSATPTPTNTPSQTVSPTPTITPTPTQLPESASLAPLNHQWQTLNNCHRASIATLMGFYDVWFSQHDHDLAMDNLGDFVSDYGLNARVYSIRYSPKSANEIVRWLLAENIPVIVGQDLASDDDTWHYRVAYGYDAATQKIFLADPLLGPNLILSFEAFDELARGVGHVIPVYPEALDEMIQSQMKAWQMKLIKYP
jgi:hypothetical protein